LNFDLINYFFIFYVVPFKKGAIKTFICDFPNCEQTFSELAHLKSHQRSHSRQTKKKKTETSPIASKTLNDLNSTPYSHLTTTSSTPQSSSSSSSTHSPPGNTSSEEFEIQKNQRKSKRKQMFPFKSPSKPECHDSPPGVVFLFPTLFPSPTDSSKSYNKKQTRNNKSDDFILISHPFLDRKPPQRSKPQEKEKEKLPHPPPIQPFTFDKEKGKEVLSTPLPHLVQEISV